MKCKIKKCIKIGIYRLNLNSIFAYYPCDRLNFWNIIVERKSKDGICELIIDFDSSEEVNKVLSELDKLLTIDPMNLRKEKLDEINENNK